MAKMRKTSRRSVIVQKGRSAKGQSETVRGAPGESVSGGAGKPAKGGAGASARAKGASATSRAVKIQSTES
ncbi:MAG: hypothetical protein Q8K79_05680 [Solirubrobacteraceae bacterium]|nr:hypothetical protein [Solirubrobacteraceae bacterium]